jgi:hypothetical protein
MFILARGTSALSIFSTTAEENQTLGPKEEESRIDDQSIEVEDSAQRALGTDEENLSMEIDVVDEAEVNASLMKPSSSEMAPSPFFVMPQETKEEIISSDSVVKEENGKLILEKYDSPAIRKQKTLLKKQERDQRRKQLAEVAALKTCSRATPSLSTASRELASSGAGPSHLPDEGDSENMDVEIESKRVQS